MFVPVLVVAAALFLGGSLAYMLLRPGSVTEDVEREVGWILREAEWGWQNRRICKHHPDFCECQVEYLKAHARVPT